MFDLTDILPQPKVQKVPFTPQFLEPVASTKIIEAVVALQEADVVFTGSISLYLHGALRPDRRILDIDIVLREHRDIPQLINRVPLLQYPTGNKPRNPKYDKLHLVQLSYDNHVKVDCFIVPDKEVVTPDVSNYSNITGIACIYKAKVEIILNLAKTKGPQWEKHSLDLLYLLLPNGGTEYNRYLLNQYS